MLKKIASSLILITFCGSCLAQDNGSFLLTPLENGRYSFKNLSSPQYVNMRANAINAGGMIVGSFHEKLGPDSAGPLRAFVWDTEHGFRELQPFEDDRRSAAYAINDLGVIAGTSFPPELPPFDRGEFRGVVWDESENILDLGHLGDGTAGSADINNEGVVVGASFRDGDLAPFVWSASDGMQFLGKLGETFDSVASAINNRNEIVGGSDGKAFRWSADGGMIDLGELPDQWIAHARDINDAGSIVGWSRRPDSLDRPFVWKEEIGMQLLPGVEGFQSGAQAVNDLGQIVGSAVLIPVGPSPRYHAMLWENGTAKDLNEWTDFPEGDLRHLQFAQDINNAGQIVGTYTIPEPSANAMFISGLLLLLHLSKRTHTGVAVSGRDKK